MFESMVLRNSEDGRIPTAGVIAEALLFYQKLHLVLDNGSFIGLINQLGPRLFLRLLERPGVNTVYCEDMQATITNSVSEQKTYQFTGFRMTGHEGVKRKMTREERFLFQLHKAGVSRTEAKKFTDRFLRLVSVRRLESDFFLPGGIAKAARLDLDDSAFVHGAVRALLADSPGAGAATFSKFEIYGLGDMFLVFDDIDFEVINATRACYSPPLEALTPAHLLTHILTARGDLAIASHYGGDFLATGQTSRLICLRYADLLRRAGINAEERLKFQEFVLPDSPSVREVIDAKERSFEEFLELIDKGDRFRKWVNEINPDEGMVRAYHREMTSNGWIEKLPSKVARYLLTSALGAVVSPLVSLAISAADALLLDRMVRGWRPSHFIEKGLKPFVQP